MKIETQPGVFLRLGEGGSDGWASKSANWPEIEKRNPRLLRGQFKSMAVGRVRLRGSKELELGAGGSGMQCRVEGNGAA